MIQLWTLGVLINLFLFYSIFDIHFKSPIVPVTRRHRLDEEKVKAPFKRVVVFGADGLRAETFYNYPDYRPYLGQVMERTSSVWGISDTRVPTESRPGHVALFAGFYEDPSAVFTGWQENTVEFDTVFNQSSKAVGLGSPDIVPMFAKGIAKDKMYSASYPRDWQDFMGENLTALDTWVFDQFSDLASQRKLPERKGALIFLHLLAIDTIGHSAKPESEEYKRAMGYVDNLVHKAEKIIESYYNDNDTLFIFTSDHGMTNWGSHGAGSEHETETPFVVWQNKDTIRTSEPLRLQQADFSALISGSIGIGFPSNSIGRFPSSFWSPSQLHFSYEALLANLHQIRDLMLTKKELIASHRNFPLVSFPLEDEILQRVDFAKELLETSSSSNGHIISAIRVLNEGITLTLEGMLYYERYDEHLLIIFTVTTTILWIFCVGLIIISISSGGGGSSSASSNQIRRLKVFSLLNSLISLVGSIFITKVLIGWSVWRAPYLFFPLFLLLLLLKLVGPVLAAGTGREGGTSGSSSFSFISSSKAYLGSLFLLLVFSGLGVELLVTGFEQRSVLAIGLMVNAIWCTRAKKVSSWPTRIVFFGAILALASFPTMPVIGKKRDPLFITLGPLLSTLLVSILLYLRSRSSWNSSTWLRRDRLIITFQIVLLLSVSILVHYPSFLLTRVIAWISLLQSYFLPVLISSDGVALRLISLFLAIASPFSFISFSYEALFFPSLFLVLLILLKIEMSEENLEDSWTEFLNLSRESRERRKMWEKVDLHQAVRRAWLHLFFVTLSFFGTGNIASVNSFDPSSTRCFVSVFQPWIMMLVLIEKILGPFLLVSCFFRRLLWNPSQVERNFLIVLLLCQGMSLHTFFQVRREGSWLEIGMSISHHVIVSATTLFLFVLHFIADFLMGKEIWREDKERRNRFAIPTVTGVGGRRTSLKKAF